MIRDDGLWGRRQISGSKKTKRFDSEEISTKKLLVEIRIAKINRRISETMGSN